MTPADFIDKALPIIRSWVQRDLASFPGKQQQVRTYYETGPLRRLWGQPSHQRTCYEKDGKHYLRSYNSHTCTPGMECYDGHNIWELDGDNLAWLGGHFR